MFLVPFKNMTFYDQILSAIREKLGIENLTLDVPREKSFGDFATNVAMRLAKSEHKNPLEVAAALIPKIDEIYFVKSSEIAGAGFINIRIKDEFIIKAANESADESTGSQTKATAEAADEPGGENTTDPRTKATAGAAKESTRKNAKGESAGGEKTGRAADEKPAKALTIDMDYGAYNVAKELHIGHLRTSIVGDTLYRVARFLGHRPVSYNHMGDWGKPMALVIAWIIRLFPDDWDKPEFRIDEGGFSDYYPAAAALAKEDPEFLAEVLRIKKEFQDGRADYFALYEKMLKISTDMMDDVVRRLNIVPFDNNLGERNAAAYLAPVEKILRDKKLLSVSDGATVVELGRESDTAPMPPFMFYDSRGADTYDSTDLATVYYRKITDDPDRIIYLTDARQKLHFEQLFRVAEMSGIFPVENMEHQYFGSINGADGRPFKTRDGNAASLFDIIETVESAAREHSPELPDGTIKMIALAALKFNDLTHDVKSDYVFDPAAVVKFEGRTGPYILYTAVRLNSALRKSGAHTARRISHIASDYERDLLLKVLEFPRAARSAFDRRAPDILANYTYDLCQAANGFYHNCPIKGDRNRAAIARNTAATLASCVGLMGLRIPKEM
jgi:arginyl-tRNA synthetase